MLERISGLLEGPGGSITLIERGDTHTVRRSHDVRALRTHNCWQAEAAASPRLGWCAIPCAQVPRHPSFRLVAAMNPATDAGKRELPATLRNRLTEVRKRRGLPLALTSAWFLPEIGIIKSPRASSTHHGQLAANQRRDVRVPCGGASPEQVWVPEPSSREDLRTLVAGYLSGLAALGAGGAGAGPAPAAAAVLASGGVVPLQQPVEACVDLYLAIKQEAVRR